MDFVSSQTNNKDVDDLSMRGDRCRGMIPKALFFQFLSPFPDFETR
jgi:hypothetical protein